MSLQPLPVFTDRPGHEGKAIDRSVVNLLYEGLLYFVMLPLLIIARALFGKSLQ